MRYVGSSYDQLSSRVDEEHEYREITLDDRAYQVTFHVFWDDKPGGLLRVWITVDDYGLSAYKPAVLCDLMAPSEVFQAALE